MRRLLAAIIIVAMSAGVCSAGEPEDQAEAFASIYLSFCMKYLPDLKALREKLKDSPKLAPDKAAHFLAGNPGDVWPVPEKSGQFVLALPSGDRVCAVYARRAGAERAESLFTRLVRVAPKGLQSNQVENTHGNSPVSGPTHTMTYEWSVKNAARKLSFTLTTTNSDSAPVQVMGAAAVLGK